MDAPADMHQPDQPAADEPSQQRVATPDAAPGAGQPDMEAAQVGAKLSMKREVTRFEFR